MDIIYIFILFIDKWDDTLYSPYIKRQNWKHT